MKMKNIPLHKNLRSLKYRKISIVISKMSNLLLITVGVLIFPFIFHDATKQLNLK